jgi:hypothetical protein
VGPRSLDSNLMPVAATAVVVIYALGMIRSGTVSWYHWVAITAGAGFATWFWLSEIGRIIHSRKKRD